MIKVNLHSGSVASNPLPEWNEEITLLELAGTEFHHHQVEEENFWDSPYLKKILEKLADQKPENYEQLLATRGGRSKNSQSFKFSV